MRSPVQQQEGYYSEFWLPVVDEVKCISSHSGPYVDVLLEG